MTTRQHATTPEEHELGDPDVVTEQCPECGAAFTGYRAGKGGKGRITVAMKMGAHRARLHGVTGKAKSTRTAEDDDRAPVRSIVSDLAAEAGAGRRGVPGEADLTRAFARGIGVVSLAVGSWAAETDPRPMTDGQRDRVAQQLAIPARVAADLATPFGRAVHSTSLNRRYGRAIVDNVDVVGSIADLGLIALRWRRYLHERASFATPGDLPGAPPPPPPPANGSPPPPPTPTPMATAPYVPPPADEPGQTSGVVWTPDMVARMRGGGR